MNDRFLFLGKGRSLFKLRGDRVLLETLFDKALKAFGVKIVRSTVNFFIKQKENIGHQ